MEITFQKSVGEVVALDYRAAAVFEKYGIDFCCKGHKSIDEACESRNIMTEEVMRELKKLGVSVDSHFTDYRSWSASLLVDYIEEKHHRYVEQKTPVILRYLEKLCNAHGDRHPELHEVNRLFRESAAEMAQHMKKEELILFPRIRQLVGFSTGGFDQNPLTPGMVQQPIKVMMEEHNAEGDRFKTIDSLTQHYHPPADACNTYKVTFALLQEFENDLHLHIHLENNILFPKAIEMEAELLN
jgi:regulator of cell morphogenesis and NO signaling